MKSHGTSRWWALAAVNLAVLAVGLDGTVLSVALPTLATALHASESDLQWFSSGYLLVLAAAMLPVGLLGDRYGRRKVIAGALVLFAAGSLACASSPSPEVFIAARALLGLAGAGVVVMALSAITVLFTREERPKAVGIWAAANFVALPIGPILGGWLLTHFWWGWVFLMNLPVTMVGLAAAVALLPESRALERPGLDMVGVVTSTAGLVGVTYGLIEAGQSGWGTPQAVGPMLAGLAVLVGFLTFEHRLSQRPGGQPLVDPALFRSPAFTWGVVLAAIGVLSMVGVLFALPQYFQGVRGMDPMGSGVRLLPLIGGLVAGALPADRVARRVGAKVTVAIGFALLAAGLLLGAATGTASPSGFIAGWTAVVGAGMGLALATAASAALSELSEGRSGIGSAVMQALQKVGGPFGSAILGSVAASVYQSRVNLGSLPPAAASVVRQSVFGGVAVAHRLHSMSLLESVHSAFVSGMDLALVASAGIAALGVVLALAFLPGLAARDSGGTAPALTAEAEAEAETREEALVIR